MTIWTLIEVVLFLCLTVGFFVLWSRLKRPPQDDPRLSRGLQLLQSKISVLEDLSDRTEVQVNQLMTLLEQKARLVQQKIQEAEGQILAIERSMKKSMEVAQIFQDKIPHEEIIERRNTVKYVQAARLAHQGLGIEEILAKVDLPRSEVEFIAKVNRDQLMFSDQNLPDWVKAMAEGEPSIEMNDGRSPQPARPTVETAPPLAASVEAAKAPPVDYSRAFAVPEADLTSLRQIGEEFRQACEDYEATSEPVPAEPGPLAKAAVAVKDRLLDKAQQMLSAGAGFERKNPPQAAASMTPPAAQTHVVPSSYLKTELKVNKDESKVVPSHEIKKVLFPRIDMNDNLG